MVRTSARGQQPVQSSSRAWTRYIDQPPPLATGYGRIDSESQVVELRIRHITTRFALLLAGAAVVPLLAYGFIWVRSLQHGTRTTVIAGNLNVATRAAEEIRRYVTSNAEILKSLG